MRYIIDLNRSKTLPNFSVYKADPKHVTIHQSFSIFSYLISFIHVQFTQINLHKLSTPILNTGTVYVCSISSIAVQYLCQSVSISLTLTENLSKMFVDALYPHSSHCFCWKLSRSDSASIPNVIIYVIRNPTMLVSQIILTVSCMCDIKFSSKLESWPNGLLCSVNYIYIAQLLPLS